MTSRTCQKLAHPILFNFFKALPAEPPSGGLTFMNYFGYRIVAGKGGLECSVTAKGRGGLGRSSYSHKW